MSRQRFAIVFALNLFFGVIAEDIPCNSAFLGLGQNIGFEARHVFELRRLIQSEGGNRLTLC